MVAGQGDDRRRCPDHDGIPHLSIRLRWSRPPVPDRDLKSGGVTSGTLVRADAARLAAGDRPAEWPWPGERVSVPHHTVRTPDGTRPIVLEATFYRPAGSGPAPLAIFTHGSDVGRNQLRSWS